MSIVQKLTEGIVNRDLAKEGGALINNWESTGLLEGLEEHLRDEIALAARALKSEDGREAVRAIFEKRKPKFTGR